MCSERICHSCGTPWDIVERYRKKVAREFAAVEAEKRRLDGILAMKQRDKRLADAWEAGGTFKEAGAREGLSASRARHIVWREHHRRLRKGLFGLKPVPRPYLSSDWLRDS